MREIFETSTAAAARGLEGLRVLLYGFSGAGFPGGDGVAEAVKRLDDLSLLPTYTHLKDPNLEAKLAVGYDVTIVCGTRTNDLLKAPKELWKSAPAVVWWFWDLRPSEVAAPLKGKVTHAYLTFNGRWQDPHGKVYDPFQWQDVLGVPVGYCPQGTSLREPKPKEDSCSDRTLFIGDIHNQTYHAGRASICRALDAIVINAKSRDARLAIEDQMASLYPSARYCLSMSPLAPGYTSVRTYSILACGGLLLLHRFPKAGNMFHSHQDCVMFDDAEDARRKIAILDQTPEQRAAIAKAGRISHAGNHTVTHRILKILHEVT